MSADEVETEVTTKAAKCKLRYTSCVRKTWWVLLWRRNQPWPTTSRRRSLLINVKMTKFEESGRMHGGDQMISVEQLHLEKQAEHEDKAIE